MAKKDFEKEDQSIYEPLKEYANVFKDRFHKNAEQFFDNLVEKSQTDVDANKYTMKHVNRLIPVRDNLKKAISRKTNFRVFLIILLIASAIALFFSARGLTLGNSTTLNIVLTVVAPILIVLSLGLIFGFLNRRIKELKTNKQKIIEELNGHIADAQKQMAALNSLFYPNMGADIFRETMPVVQLDNEFDSRRYDYMHTRYGLGDLNGITGSTLFVQSGEISGNPFYIARNLKQSMFNKTYSGSMVITYWVGSGKNRTMVTQTLVATVSKPCPFYATDAYLVYGNEAAPDLSFSRKQTDVENMTEKQIARKVKRGTKQLQAQARQATKKGGTFTAMGNNKFDVIFGARDRDNEVQFRMLFTPLAQKQLLQLMKEKEYGYGDDFDYYKTKKINLLIPAHLQRFEICPPVSFFQGIDLEKMKKIFITYHDEWFRQIYFTLAPVLSIPLFQQHKPPEYIYKDSYPSYVSFYEHESYANCLNSQNFAHPNSITNNILKTRLLRKEPDKDIICVTAHGFRGVRRTELIPRVGGNGRTYMIPVRWIEYIPVQKDTNIEVPTDTTPRNETPHERVARIIEELRSGSPAAIRRLQRFGVMLAPIGEPDENNTKIEEEKEENGK